MDLQESGVRQVEILSRRIVRYVLLKGMRDERETTGLGACGVDDAHPVGIRLSVERTGVVIDAIGQKLETCALGRRVPVLHSLDIRARGELRRMAGDA